MSIRASSLASLLLIAAAVVECGPAASATFIVNNYGTDSGSCGWSAQPCRSISQAIENAAAGDVIWVGPGTYGDLSGDGNFDAPGSEHPSVLPDGFHYLANECVVCISKAVKIYSYAGAAMTTIQSPTPSQIGLTRAVVLVNADGVVFGAKGHGFTISGGNSVGVAVDFERLSGSRSGVTVAGNVDLKDEIGFAFHGTESSYWSCPPNYQQYCPGFIGNILIFGNQAIGSGIGFWAEPQTISLGAQHSTLKIAFYENLALGTGTGFHVYPGISGECDECNWGRGDAADVVTVHNVAANGRIGFSLNKAGSVQNNIASNNTQVGFMMVDAITFVGNSAIGNAGPGVVVSVEAAINPSDTPRGFGTFVRNNLAGNDRNRPALSLGGYGPPYDFNPGPSAHCGVLNMGAIQESNSPKTGHPPPSPPIPSVILQAASNFWGSSAGAQTNGSGDAAGGVCDQNNAVTISKPFATTPAGITPLP